MRQSSARESTASAGSSSNKEQKRLVRSGLLLASLLLCDQASAFVIHQQRSSRQQQLRELHASNTPEDEIPQQLQRAREVLAKSKAKLEVTGDAQPDEIPFFATSASMDRSTKREKVTKSLDQDTGLITADGEKMAKISEIEQWEMRSLGEVFENEMEETEDVNSVASKHLADRDVAASIFNLRKQMQTEDYRRIFDTSNRFIGEDT